MEVLGMTHFPRPGQMLLLSLFYLQQISSPNDFI